MCVDSRAVAVELMVLMCVDSRAAAVESMVGCAKSRKMVCSRNHRAQKFARASKQILRLPVQVV